MNAATYERSHLYIGGDWQRSADPAMTEIVNPATEKTFGAAPAGTMADVDRAVDSAGRALRSGPWARSTGSERAGWMRALAAQLAARGDDTARLVSGENGMPISLARVAEGQGPAATMSY